MRERIKRSLLHDGFSLSERSVEKCMIARDDFMLLNERERIALLPALLALQNGPIETLHQAGDLWADLPPLQRATAIMGHCARCAAHERQQVVRLCVQTCTGDELLELLRFVSDGAATYWSLNQPELVQAFLEAQPERVARLAEDKLLDGIVDSLPTDAVARSMQRLALFAHLPPVRARLPKAHRAFERIEQYPNPPPRSEARPHPKCAGGLFGPPPAERDVLLDGTEIHAPQDTWQHSLPSLSPRSKPQALERRIAASRNSNLTAGQVAARSSGSSPRH